MDDFIRGNARQSASLRLDLLNDGAAVRSTDLRLDHSRLTRTGIPEVVYGETKSVEQIVEGMKSLYASNGVALATRVPADVAAGVYSALPEVVYNGRARTLRWGALPKSSARTAVVCAGTSDLPVADEAASTLEAFGHDVERFSDVGVAGIHRTLAIVEDLDRAHSIIVVAGMEGALPSVVAGLVRRPLIAVPTSVGYGASRDGFTALFTMLSSCAPGIAVVNIDNGFGAAALAHKIAASRE